jgi:hypothetical protein
MKRVALVLTVITVETISALPLIVGLSGDSNHLSNQFLPEDRGTSDTTNLKLTVTTGKYETVNYQRDILNFELHVSALFMESS